MAEQLTYQWRSSLQRKRGRAYSRLIAGIIHGKARDFRMRVFTLTSSPESEEGMIRKHFQVLRKRIESEFKKKLEYCCISTKEGPLEGHGVLHIVSKGVYLPVEWLSEQWNDIHKAKVVYAQELYGSPGSMAGYLIRYYQGHEDFRLSWSWGWVFRGFCHMFKQFFKYYGYINGIKEWNGFLKQDRYTDLKEWAWRWKGSRVITRRNKPGIDQTYLPGYPSR